MPRRMMRDCVMIVAFRVVVEGMKDDLAHKVPALGDRITVVIGHIILYYEM